MTIKYLIDKIRDRLNKNPDDSAFMADIYGATYSLTISSLSLIIYYTHHYDINMEFIQIVKNPVLVAPTDADVICWMKSSEVESDKWVYRVGNDIDILHIDEELDSSYLLRQIELHYGQAVKSAISRLPSWMEVV